MTADSLNKTVSDEDMKKALSAIKTLKAYRCWERLDAVKDKWFQTGHFDKFPENALKEQLINSNLTDHFEQALSINAIEKYKPAAETHFTGWKPEAVKPQEMIMIAAHGFSRSRKCRFSWILAREGQSLYHIVQRAWLWSERYFTMAEKLVATYINNFREKFIDVNFIQF
jgi:2-haloacid dehalogenase